MTHGSRKAANALAQPPPFIRLHYPSAWMRRCLDAVACPVHSNTTVRHVHADLGPRHAISKSGRSREYIIDRSEEHTSELQSLMRISYAVFCLKKTKH